MTDRTAGTEPDQPYASSAAQPALGPFESDGPEDRGTIYSLGIFLLLLAFFILLGAIARLDDVKSRGVMSSVAATFRSNVDPQAFSELFVSQLGNIVEPAVLLEGIEGLWLTAVPVTRVEVLQPGRTMELSVPLRELFVGRTAALRADRMELFKHTIAALSVPIPDQVLQLSAFSGPERRPRAGEGALAFERAVAVATALEALGTPPEALSAGLDPASAGRFRLRFAFRDRTAAAVTFGAPALGTLQ